MADNQESGATANGTAGNGTGNSEATKPVIISGPQPAAPNGFVDMVKNLFHFKTEKLKNEKGEVIDKGTKHPSVEIFVPVPKAERLAEFLLDGEKYPKERELLISAASDIVIRMARMQVNAFRENTPEAQVNPSVIDYDKLDWTAIANMPKAERGAFVPDEEDTKAFLESYLEIMPEATGKPKKNIENHVLCFSAGFKKQRAQKEILEMFQSALAVYVANATEELLAEHAEVIEYFDNRLKRMLKSEEKITMDDL